MNSLKINQILERDPFAKDIFYGVLARDQLPRNIKYPTSFVINTDVSSKPGEHWLAIFYDKNGVCEFFDPLGFSPKYYKLDDYLKKTSTKFYYNTQQMQGIFSKYCGHYCILYLLVKSRQYNLTFFLKLFTKNTKFNDEMIEKIIKENFFV